MQKPLQIIALDAKAAFDTIYPISIADAMTIFGIPERMVQYIHQLTKDGVARVKINNNLSDKIILKTGVGQGDPLSSLRYILGQEPFNQVIRIKLTQLQYTNPHTGKKTLAVTFADDNAHPTELTEASQLETIYKFHDEFAEVTGVKLNHTKTKILTINTPRALRENINALGKG